MTLSHTADYRSAALDVDDRSLARLDLVALVLGTVITLAPLAAAMLLAGTY